MTVPRVMVVGTGCGVGTSTIIQGLIVALKRSGVSLALGKVGSSLVDATHQRRLAGRLAHTLDFWMLSKPQVHSSLARLSVGAELVIIEGQYGLFDTRPQDFSFQRDADFAARFGIPVILVVDARGYREGIAALVKGFMTFFPDAKLFGVIANWVESEEHGECIRSAIEALRGPRYLGGVPRSEALQPFLSVQGGVEENKSLLTRNRIIAAGDLIGNSIALNLLREGAAAAPQLEVDPETLQALPRQCRIAVADDASLHLTIQDNLDLIRRAGAEIVAFSPLADVKLPARTSALYIPSGYVGLYAADLQANQAIRAAIREFAQQGGAIYGEGDAVAYLFEEVMTRKGEKFSMVGLIPGVATEVVDAVGQERLSYCELVSREDTIMSRTGDRFRGVRDNRWIYRSDQKAVQCFQLRDRTTLLRAEGRESPGHLEGFSPLPHVVTTTVQLHWGSLPSMARMFCDSARACAPSVKGPKEKEVVDQP